jgi:hypothetical protein
MIIVIAAGLGREHSGYIKGSSQQCSPMDGNMSTNRPDFIVDPLGNVRDVRQRFYH